MSTTTFSRYADLPALIGLMTGDEKHQAAAESTLDVLWVLYDRVLAVTPETADHPDRDRFLLSKGHGPAAFYAVLAAKGFIDVRALRSWAEFDSPLGHHPDRTLVPGAEIGSGSLGHGLGLGVGTALALRAQGRTRTRVVVLVGDAELDVGSNCPGGTGERFARVGWAARSVGGRDHTALYDAFTLPHSGRPLAVVARVNPKG
jgi:transketolase